MLIEMSFKELISEKKFQGLTENSLKSYDNLFSVLGEWLRKEKIEHTQDLTSSMIKNFLKHCMEQGNKTNQKLSTQN